MRGAVVISAVLLTAVGCHHTHSQQIGPHDAMAPITVPPAGTVPRELDKITLPPYVIEAPDQLLIEVVQRSKVPDLDEKTGKQLEGPDGKKLFKQVTDRLPVQPISGPFQVRPDGTVGLGFWGDVPVAGLTMESARETILRHVVQKPALREFGTSPESLFVIIHLLAYNSKRYQVFSMAAGSANR